MSPGIVVTGSVSLRIIIHSLTGPGRYAFGEENDLKWLEIAEHRVTLARVSPSGATKWGSRSPNHYPQLSSFRDLDLGHCRCSLW